MKKRENRKIPEVKSLIFDLGGVLILKNKRTPGGRYQLVNRSLMRFLKKIKHKYKLYSLTNIDESHHNLNKKRGIYNAFKKVYASCEVGTEKPDKKMFLAVLKENSLIPEETLMVDDKEEHLEVAKNLGIKTILFKNNKQLFKQLKQSEVEI